MRLSLVLGHRPAIAAVTALALWASTGSANSPSGAAAQTHATAAATADSVEMDSLETETNWEFATRDDTAGWALYTAPVPGSDHPRYRLISQSPEPVERVARALRLKIADLKYMQDGFDRTVLSRGDGFMINYVRMDVPVVADRDVVVETRWWTDPETSVYHVSWAPPNGEIPPVPEGVSRIESRGTWEITPLAGGGSKLVYTQHSELGNSMPAWLVGRLMNAQIINEYLTLNEILGNDLPDVAAPPALAVSPTSAID